MPNTPQNPETLQAKQEKRAAQNRLNAQKSTGPKTPEGKSRSSRNAVKHGITAAACIISTENLPEYESLRQAYMLRFDARDQVEIDLVDRLVAAEWNLRRIRTAINESLNLQLSRMEADIARQFEYIPDSARLALALEKLADTPAFQLLQRYQTRCQTDYNRALKSLLEIRKNFPVLPAGAPLPNKATAIPPEPPADRQPVVGNHFTDQPLSTTPEPATGPAPAISASPGHRQLK